MKRRWAALCLVMWLSVCVTASVVPVTAVADGPVFSELQEITAYIRACADDLREEIVFYYTDDLEGIFDSPDALWDMCYNCHLIDWSQYCDPDRQRVRIAEIEYYPGFRIARAVEREDMSILNADERSTLTLARQMVEDARRHAQSPYEVLRQIHDRLVSHVTYTDMISEDGWLAGDTALGALLYGEADCDGYADAFVLLGELAGFEVGLQRGMADNGEVNTRHIWNLLKIDDLWYQVDVTWDDMDHPDDPTMCYYRYFVIGSEMLRDSHAWDEVFSPYDQASWNNWDWFFYTCDRSGLAYGAYYETLQEAADYARYMQQEQDARHIHVMVDGTGADGAYFNDVLKHAGLKGRWTTWATDMGEYTCFDIRMRD